jgi:antiviral defense system Shedu protein SduA
MWTTTSIHDLGGDVFVRTDSQLKFLLLDLHERAHPDVSPHLMDALDMMGDRSPYKGGRKLLELLEFIEREASAVQDALTAEGVRDAVAYASGRMLGYDLERKYDLYDGSGQDLGRQLERLVSGMHGLAAEEVSRFLAEHPDATTAQVMAHLVGQSTLAVRFTKARRAGHYGAFRMRTDGVAWVTDVLTDRTTFLTTAPLPPDAEHLIVAAQIKLRLAKLDEIERAVENPFSKERNLQRLVEKSPWLFGGEYVDTAGVRRLTPGNEVDIALLRPDGVLHVIELKQANLRVVKYHRSTPIPTADVHDAVMQVSNYLRDFDERRTLILETYGIDVRRASGTVVIGHPKFDTAFTEREVNEAVRTYVSQQSRIDVITYKQLIDSARRSLQLQELAQA